jgi:hypothetical protein
MTEYPIIIDNFIPKEDAERFNTFLASIVQPLPNKPKFRIAMGYPTSIVASKVGYSIPVLEGYEGTEHEQTVKDLGELLIRVKETLESSFSAEMDTVQYVYNQMLEGAKNSLHSDSSKLDGSPLNEDGTPEELQWSALVYLSSYDEEFTGGKIVFPKQEISHEPVEGQLVFFKGDHEHPHEVEVVTGGVRSALVFFFGKRGDLSNAVNFTK